MRPQHQSPTSAETSTVSRDFSSQAITARCQYPESRVGQSEVSLWRHPEKRAPVHRESPGRKGLYNEVQMPEIGTQLPAPAHTLPLPGLPSPPTNLSLPAGQAPVALSVFVMGPPSPLFLHLLLSVSPEEEASTQPSCPQRPGTPNVEWAQDSGEVSESRSEAGEGRLPLWHLWLHGASLR